MKKITFPISEEQLMDLKAGDRVLASGYLYTARDAAHKRMYELLQKGEPLPVDISGQTIYYVGAAPAKPGCAVGPCGPTSSYRMDKYAPSLLDLGLKVMIGKGMRSDEVINSIIKNKAVYLIAIGGAAALIAKSIKKSELICYEDFGTEAIYRYEVEDMPLIVGIDSIGGNVYVR
ncbi:MAG: Fe-S-containing hydro-lyase [Clostridia bacterium]|nr:Fe-S-containing hydro-lyase [Clostridia bacterium]